MKLKLGIVGYGGFSRDFVQLFNKHPDVESLSVAELYEERRADIKKDFPNATIYTSYDEMLEAATAGAKVLHNRAVKKEKKYRLKINVKNTRGDNEGTEVDETNIINECYKAKIVAEQKGLSKITLIGKI